MLGAFGVGLWLLAGAIKMTRLCHAAQSAPAEFVEALTKIVGPAREVPQLLVSNKVSSAVVLGVFRPTILVPVTLEASELRSALAHEWAHVRHGDLRMVAQLRVLLLVLFVHPLYWYFRCAVRRDQELLADAIAAKHAGRSIYAEQLVKWARQICTERRVHLPASLGITESKSELSRRVQVLLDDTKQVYVSCSRRWRCSAMCVVTVVALLTSLVTLEPQSSAQVNTVQPTKALSRQRQTDTTVLRFGERTPISESWQVSDFALSMDGSRMVLGAAGGGQVSVWDLESNRRLYEFGGEGHTANCVAISRQGDLVAAGNDRYGSGANLAPGD